jgi:hypothetical protein
MSQDDINDTDPITLEEACRLVFRKTCTVWTLRAEASRGRLEVAKIGKRYYTTLRAARSLYSKCLEGNRRPDSTLTHVESSGSSETARSSSARAALRQSVSVLKKSSPNTSPKSTNRSVAHRH